MELRRRVRDQNVKKIVDSSDEEEEKPLTKKTKLSANGSHIKIEQPSFQEFGVGKRIRKKNVLFKNFKVFDDSDSEFEAGFRSARKSGGTKKRTPKGRELTKIEFLLDWKRELIASDLPTLKPSYKVVNSKNIVDADLKQYGNNLQALFINIKWHTKYSPTGVKIDQFKKINLDKKLIKNGIIFIWSEKEILGKLMKIMEEKGFVYIENFVVALLNPLKIYPEEETPKEPVQKKGAKKLTKSSLEKLPSNQKGKKKAPVVEEEEDDDDSSDSESTTESPQKRRSKKMEKELLETEFDQEDFLKNLHKYPDLEADQLLHDGQSDYLKSSKKVLMMFRIVDPKETSLELRHQRTSDALFDIVDPSNPHEDDPKSKEYVYKLIETLLPKALYTPGEKSLKMMELWADSSRPREGWVSVCEK